VSFKALQHESRALNGGTEEHAPWHMVFVAALSGTADAGPTATQCDAALQRMVAAIKAGNIGDFIAFDADGLTVRFS